MTEATITLGEAQEPTTPAEPASNEHDVAIAEAEAAAEIAVAEINAEAREAEAERIADAIETAAERTEEEEIQWLRERVAFLEGQQASPPILMAETVTLETDPSTPPNLSETDPTETLDPTDLEPTDQTPPPLSDGSPTDDPASVEDAPPAEVPAPARRKRRLLI